MRRRRKAALAAVLVIGMTSSTVGARPLEVIRDRGVLSLCAHANSLPFASKTQDPPGFQIELGRALAAVLGVSLNVEWVTSRIQLRIADCDIVLDTIVLPEAQAERGLQLSKPYQRSGVGLTVRSTTHDLKNFSD